MSGKDMDEKTTRILFALLRCGICGERLAEDTVKACTPEQLEAVYTLSKKHDLAHVAAHALESLELPACEALESLKKAKMRAVYRYIRLDHEFNQICKVLEKGDIPFMPLKGSVLRPFYAEPWMRSSCDIDVLVKQEDLLDAVLLLEEAGYQRKGKSHHDVSLYAPSGVHLELHYSLAEDGLDSVPVQEILASVWETVERKSGTKNHYLMTDEMFYLYHMAHMATHFLRGGCGIRTCLDIWILNNRVSGNSKNREKLLKRGGLLAFAKAAEKLSDCWFSNVSMDEDTARFGDCVLRGGIYGNKDNGAVMQKAADTKLNIPFHRILIPYEDLRYYYPVLDTKIWLTPVCQVLRWFRLLGILWGMLKKWAASRKVSRKAEAEVRQLLRYLEL